MEENKIKQTVTYGIWKVVRYEDNKMKVYKNGQLCDNSSAALREIASEIGLEVNPDWRTSQLGRNVQKAILLDETPVEIQQDTNNKELVKNQIGGHFLYPVPELYDGKNIKTELLRPVPFLYRWWFVEGSKPMQLLEKYINENPGDVDMLHVKAHLKSICLNDKTYYALYLGKSINGRNRFSQHIRGNVDLSTLRKTICAVLLLMQEDASEENISNVLSECYYEWVELEHDKELVDSFEMLAISLGNYPYNIDGNSAVSPQWKQQFISARQAMDKARKDINQ